MTPPKRTPPGGVDALAEVMHAAICLSEHPHGWRDHSGDGYRKLGAQAMRSLAAHGLTITRIT